ncbi:hypothetical protein OsJ_02148 [Oryza sativa Japonica Group]|uniref:Uncharacterized protein n=1 Tax=Oryza sativa subsp. japonica TaxID=39947 RepID=B9EXF3_ORYSJ|nr:hypothetical protein OsJ_02148 [Oryza sativa Japonica Group]
MYRVNLDGMSESLFPEGTCRSGCGIFVRGSSGADPDKVYAVALCRGDVDDAPACSSCFDAAFRRAMQLCPRSKDATIYYDECLLRFSDTDILNMDSVRRLNTSEIVHGALVLMNLTSEPMLPGRSTATANFTGFLKTMLTDVVGQVLSTRRHYAAIRMEMDDGSSSSTTAVPREFYCLAQCAPDLIEDICYSCLTNFSDRPVASFPGRQGWRVLGLWCNLRDTIASVQDGIVILSQPHALTDKNGHNQVSFHGGVVAETAYFVSTIKNEQKFSQVATPILDQVLKFYRLKRLEPLPRYDTKKFYTGAPTWSSGSSASNAIVPSPAPQPASLPPPTPKHKSKMNTQEDEALIWGLEGRSSEFTVYDFSHVLEATDETRRALVDWNKRLAIINGIAQGLLYLHKHSRLRIIHRDLKAGNILLDHEMNPKISDFGLAKIFSTNDTEGNTKRIVGTYGYMAPEYASEGLFSIKSDVFSFGVLILETVSGKRTSSFHRHGDFINLLGHAWQMWKDETWLQLVDTSLVIESHTPEMARCINIALLCVQENAADRPTMSEVVAMLTSESMTLPEPKYPAFYHMRVTKEEPSTVIMVSSANGITLSVVDGR